MKLLYVVTTYVEAESAQEAVRLSRDVRPHEVNLHGKWWENQNFALKEEQPTPIGFSKGKRNAKSKIQPTSP